MKSVDCEIVVAFGIGAEFKLGFVVGLPVTPP